MKNAIASLLIITLLAGCSVASLSPANCPDAYRDTTIDEIRPDSQDTLLNLAGKVTMKRPNQNWILITDGTGTAKVSPAYSDAADRLMRQPTGQCIEFSARVGSVINGENVDVNMYLGEHVKTINASSP